MPKTYFQWKNPEHTIPFVSTAFYSSQVSMYKIMLRLYTQQTATDFGYLLM